jgi:transglutaminase-like putative cysteine protease
VDVLVQRAGVCRDFAHLSISFCRALGIPARYVAGYAPELQPPDFHGFFEAYLDGRWYLFDATKLAPVNGFVRIGTGRDAADASFATLVGAATMQNMMVSAVTASGEALNDTGIAVSTS